MTMQDLIVESLERIGASGLAYASAKTTADFDYVAIAGIKPRHEMCADLGEEFMDDCIVVWASADGTLFPSAEERDAYEDKTNTPGLTNAEHFHHNAIGDPVQGGNRSYNAWMKACPYQNTSGDCSTCGISRSKTDCRQLWDKAPYGMPLDRRIPWPSQP